MIRKINLQYNFGIFLDADYSQHYGSCISYQQKEQEDVHKNVGGFPKSYHENNTRIQQLWWDNDQVDYKNLGEQLGMEIITISTILQPPGNVVTVHRDTFFQINKKFPNNTRQKARANVYLEDWKVGHFINYQDKSYDWKTNTHWKQGEGFIWDSSHLHLSANAGLEPKYTLQISGFLNE